MPRVNATLFFVSGSWFYYGQGDDIVGCFADVYEEDLAKQYPKAFNLVDAVSCFHVVDTESYYVCYDDANDCGQKVFRGTGAEIKDKLLNMYMKGKVDASWIFPMSKMIKTKELETEIRSNPKSYKKVARWIGEKDW